jgi:hypothetical protein
MRGERSSFGRVANGDSLRKNVFRQAAPLHKPVGFDRMGADGVAELGLLLLPKAQVITLRFAEAAFFSMLSSSIAVDRLPHAFF